jgi:hypothetical protein
VDVPERTYEVGEAVRQIAVLEDFDRELERLEKLASSLADRLDPVLNQYAREQIVEADGPRPEASSQIRGRLERLRDTAARFDRILRDVDL